MAKTKLLIAVAAVAALTSGCGGTVPVNSPGSPLGTGGDPFRVCTPNPSGQVMTIGAVLENHSSQPVTVERVAYYRPSNLGIAQAVVVPIGSYAIGNSLGWPRTAVSQDPSIRHDRLVPAAGAKVPPHTDLAGGSRPAEPAARSRPGLTWSGRGRLSRRFCRR